MMDKRQLPDQLSAARQEHLAEHLQTLPAGKQERLRTQLARCDLALVERLFRSADSKQDWAQIALRATPPPAVRRTESAATATDAIRTGQAALAAGKVGVIVVAGGQGSRLGFEHPKGMFPIGPVSGATLLQVLLEKIAATAKTYGAAVPLCLMTSPATHEETVEYLARQDRFGLPLADVHVFCQGTMPAVDAGTGKLLLAAPGELALSPDGHGGMLSALAASGGLSDLRRRGIEQMFYCQVDNPLTTICDPALIGHHLLAESEYTLQVVDKRDPRENLGSVAVVDGELMCIEYSDLNPLADELVMKRDKTGSPVFWAGSIAVHMFSVDFLARMAADAERLPFHVAKKSVPYLAATGECVTPSEKNAIKFERFIFDLLPAAKRALVVEVDPAATFAPVKNSLADATDNPATVQAQMIALHRRWLEEAGAQVAPGVAVEISPLFALDAQQTAARISPGLCIREPAYFRPAASG